MTCPLDALHYTVMVYTYSSLLLSSIFFFFTATAPTAIYTLSLHDALPISLRLDGIKRGHPDVCADRSRRDRGRPESVKRRTGDRKSTRLNSSHITISYAVFCLKKKKKRN